MGTRHTTYFMDKEYPNIAGGGGGAKMDVLYLAESTTPPQIITLNKALTDYDYIVTHIKSTAPPPQATIGYIHTVESLAVGDVFGGELAAGDGTIWYTYTNATTLTFLGRSVDYYISEITGIKFGESGGGGGGGSATHYHVFGIILDSHSGGTMTARGCADITIIGNLARVDFMITEKYNATHGDGYNWGINPALFTQIDSNIPLITPIAKQGSWDAFGYNWDRMQYGTTFDVSGDRWRPVRYYTTDGNTGAWSETVIPNQYRGTCYGIIQS